MLHREMQHQREKRARGDGNENKETCVCDDLLDGQWMDLSSAWVKSQSFSWMLTEWQEPTVSHINGHQPQKGHFFSSSLSLSLSQTVQRLACAFLTLLPACYMWMNKHRWPFLGDQASFCNLLVQACGVVISECYCAAQRCNIWQQFVNNQSCPLAQLAMQLASAAVISSHSDHKFTSF